MSLFYGKNFNISGIKCHFFLLSRNSRRHEMARGNVGTYYYGKMLIPGGNVDILFPEKNSREKMSTFFPRELKIVFPGTEK